MSMYNAIFGRNPASGVLLAMLGLTQGDIGRFRDAYVTEKDGGPVIAIYTRNGGGNREHYAYDQHDVFDRETRKSVHYCHWNYEMRQWVHVRSDCPFGKDPEVGLYDAHEPVFPEGPECDCTGCTISYRIPAMMGYLYDEYDEFDSTYCTIYFRPQDDDWRDLLAGMVREGSPDTDWQDFLTALNDPPADPETRPQKLAARMIAGLKA